MNRIIGFGSLICNESLAGTISARKSRPVTIKGYKRFFNLSILGGHDPNVLSVQQSRGDFLNAVMFEATDEELEKLKQRERHYTVEQTQAFDFITGNLLCSCSVFVGMPEYYDFTTRRPNRPYFLLCRKAAYILGPAFGTQWDDTTFTSGNQPISEWIKSNPEYDNLDYDVVAHCERIYGKKK